MERNPGLIRRAGSLEIVREPNDQDRQHVAQYATVLKAQMPDYTDENIIPILATEGWLSRESVDRDNTIIRAEGWREDLPDFLRYPAFMFNHDWGHLPLGIWTELTIKPGEGLWGKNVIFDTGIGRDAALLVNAGVLRAYSVGFMLVDWERPKSGEPWIFIRQALIEGSLVSVPAHLDASVESVERQFEETMQAAQTQGIKLKYFNLSPRQGRGTKGVKKMNPEDVQVIVDKGLTSVAGKFDGVEVTMKEAGARADKLAQLISELKQSVADGKKSTGELLTLVDKVSADFVKGKEDFDLAVKEVKSRKTISTGIVLPTDLKSLCLLEPRELRDMMPTQDAERVISFQKKKDELVIVDRLLEASSKNHNGNYHQTPRNERVRSLQIWKEVEAFAKAMDTETATEGLEWVHTLASGNLIELVRLELKVAGLFPEIVMPSATFEIDTEGADTIATLAGQVITVVSSLNTVEQTPGTGKITLSAKKARGRYQISVELTEDAARAIMPWAQRKLVRSIARAEDRGIINADDSVGTHIDSGYTVGATDFRKAWDGLRYHWLSNVGISKGVDLGTCDESNWVKMRANMGKYGLYPSQLVHIISITTYLLRLLNKDNFPSFQTLDKYGPQAVVLTGELGRTWNVPNIVSEFMEETQNAGGIYENAGVTDRASAITVNREMWIRGVRRGVEVLVDRDILNDVYQLVAYKRVDFKPTVTPSASEVIVNVGYNIPTT